MRSLLVLPALWWIALAAAQPAEPVAAAATAAGPVQVVAPGTADRAWLPTDAQRQRIVEDTLAYLAAKDERRFADAYARFAASQKSVVPLDRWLAHMEAFYGRAGAPQGRTLRQVTWYRNPPDAPPGIYAAVDLSSRFSGLSLHCGYVAWREQPDGSFEVVREEENSIPIADMGRLTPEMLRSVRAQFGC